MISTQGFGPKQALKPAGKFPVFKTAWAACRFLFRNWRGFAKAAFVPVLLALAVDLSSGEWTETSAFVYFIVSLAHSFPETLFSVAWYQFYLVGPAQAAPRWIPSWTSRHWRFLGYTLAFNALISVMIDLPLGYMENEIVFGIVFVAIIPMLFIFTRVSLIFPAISIGQHYGLGRSWRHSAGNGWRILSAYLLLVLPMILGTFLVGFAAFFGLNAVLDTGVDAMDFGVDDYSLGWAFVFVEALIWELMGFVYAGLCLVVLSIAFQFCTTLRLPATSFPG
jgi:hypothetical protein